MLNHCTLIGTIASAPEERNAGSKTVLNFRLKTWKTFNGKSFDSYHTINIWSDFVKSAARSFQEGQMVMVQGDYGTKMVEKNGQKTYYSSLTANSAQAVTIEGTTPQQDTSSQGYSTPPQGGGRGPVSTGNPAPSGYSGNNDDSDIPF